MDRCPEIVSQTRQHRVVHGHAGPLRAEEHRAGPGAEPGRGPVGRAPEADAPVAPLPAAEGRDRDGQLTPCRARQGRIAQERTGLDQRDERHGLTRDLLRAPVGIDLEPFASSAHERERRRAETHLKARARGIDIGGGLDLGAGGVVQHARGGVGARVVRRANRERERHRIGIRTAAGIEPEPHAVGVGRAEVEPRLAAAARLERDGAAPVALDLGALGLGGHCRLPHGAVTAVHHHAGGEPVVPAQEARERRTCHQRTRHQEGRRAVAVAVARGDRDRHHPEGGEIVGQPGRGDGLARCVGHHRAEKERGGLKP